MIDEIHIAARYGQRVILRLENGEKITGKAEPTCYPNGIKIRTVDGPVWVPIDDIEFVERLVNLH